MQGSLRNAFAIPTRSIASDFKWHKPKSMKPGQHIVITSAKQGFVDAAKRAALARTAI